jgi:predicted CXXCH cytochrome family protein
MQALIRQCKDGPDGATEYTDTEVSADSLTLGSAADCTIQLIGEAVAVEHAVIRAAGGAIALTCRAGQRVVLNGTPTGAATLKLGDRIEIGGHRLRMVSAPAGFDLAIEIRPDTNVDAGTFERAFRTDLSETWLSRRRGAWMLLLLALIGGLLIPLAMIYVHRAGHHTPPGLVDDSFWTAGPLSPAHELATGKRCDGCHQSLFVHVRDSACLDCHKSVGDHIAPDKLAMSSFKDRRQPCADCHQEHNTSAASVIIRSNSLCTHCHADVRAFPGPKAGELKAAEQKPAAVTGFAAGEHPAFTVALLKPGYTEGVTVAQWKPSMEPISRAQEQSNLTFSHAQHLEPTRVRRRSDGSPLGCADCHVLGADGEHFIPVTMQGQCISCHELAFDAAQTSRQLPHGKPRDAILLIQDYYARRVIDPHPPAAAQTESFQRRRLPGEADSLLFEDTADVCKAATFDCAMQRANAQIDKQFNVRGCKSCHAINDTHAANVLDRYQVLPIRLTYDYFPHTHFSHRSHAVQKGKTGDEACESCHSATTNEKSTTVMIPDLPKCLECHTQNTDRDKVQLQCISCHTYHPKQIIAVQTGTQAPEGSGRE